MKYMKRVYFTAAIIIFVLLAITQWGSLDRRYISYQIAAEGGIPNTVSIIYLRNRLYDTIFEVMLFSVSIMGALYFLDNRNKYKLERSLHLDPATAIMFKGAGFLSFLFGCALALAGHLSPGGGFAAGVALGTSMVIQTLVKDNNRLNLYLSGERPEKMEKRIWLLTLCIAMTALCGIAFREGSWGSLFSGGWIPVLNILIAIKVGLGTWALSLGFLDHRWIF